MLPSPNTLNVTLANALPGGAASQPNMSRKKRRRPGNAKKGTAAAIQLVHNNKEVVHRVVWLTYHSPGEPILPKELSNLLQTELRLLHDTILCREKAFSHAGEHRPVFTVMVLPNIGLCDIFPVVKFYMPFEDIFNLFHLYKLGPSLIRQWQSIAPTLPNASSTRLSQ